DRGRSEGTDSLSLVRGRPLSRLREWMGQGPSPGEAQGVEEGHVRAARLRPLWQEVQQTRRTHSSQDDLPRGGIGVRPKSKGVIWLLRLSSRTCVRVDPRDEDRIEVKIQGVSCDVVGTLTRNDARLLAKRINQCL